MIAITTRSTIRVNPLHFFLLSPPPPLQLQPRRSLLFHPSVHTVMDSLVVL
jgi:hypothetical protein